jgi:heterodisulfide reductase subunit C
MKKDMIIPNIRSTFRKEVLRTSHSNFLQCYQCGTCDSTCTVEKYEYEYRPLEIIRMAMLGVDELLTSEEIWYCTTCLKCDENCPQKVKPSNVVASIQAIAFKEGAVPKNISLKLKVLAEKGLLGELTSMDAKKKKELGIDPVLPEVGIKDVEKIIKKTGLSGIIGGNK